jgi:hypothetical protein
MRCLLFLAPIGKLPQANIQNGSHGGTDERTGSRQDRVSDHGTPAAPMIAPGSIIAFPSQMCLNLNRLSA